MIETLTNQHEVVKFILFLSVLVLSFALIKVRLKYKKFKKLHARFEYHNYAVEHNLREGGIFTKSWSRLFIKDAERWF